MTHDTGATPVLVSACLLGERCRYNGDDKYDAALVKRLERSNAEVIPICPEVAGGLGVPRPACDVEGGNGSRVLSGEARVLTKSGEDKTAAFLRGAELAAEAASRFRVRLAVLKQGSPSCGAQGVTAARLRASGIAITFEDDSDDQLD